MRSFIIVTCCACVFLSATAEAQSILKVSHGYNRPVIMKYLPRNQRGQKMNKVTIPAGMTKEFELFGADPFDVNCFVENEDSFQVQVMAESGVPLQKWAKSEKTFELELTFAERKENGRKLKQTMSATLVDAANGDSLQLFEAPDQASDFVTNVLDTQWQTNRKAIDTGNNDQVELDFNNLTFKSNRVSGRIRRLAVVEDDAQCHIVGRWWIRDDRQGDVYFIVTKANPDVIQGRYTLDGQEQEYEWNSR